MWNVTTWNGECECEGWDDGDEEIERAKGKRMRKPKYEGMVRTANSQTFSQVRRCRGSMNCSGAEKRCLRVRRSVLVLYRLYRIAGIGCASGIEQEAWIRKAADRSQQLATRDGTRRNAYDSGTRATQPPRPLPIQAESHGSTTHAQSQKPLQTADMLGPRWVQGPTPQQEPRG